MSDTDRCIWCEQDRDLVDKEYADAFLAVSPDGDVLHMTYGVVCGECWDNIREQWETMGDLSKPLASYGGAA